MLRRKTEEERVVRTAEDWFERIRESGLCERTKPEITKKIETEARPEKRRRMMGSWRK